MPGRRRPAGQHRKRPLAWATTAPANPDLSVSVFVCVFEALSVTYDGPFAANRAEAREQLQRDLGYPGPVLFSISSNATKRIADCVKPVRKSSRRPISRGWPSPPGKSESNEKRISRNLSGITELFSTRDVPLSDARRRLVGHPCERQSPRRSQATELWTMRSEEAHAG